MLSRHAAGGRAGELAHAMVECEEVAQFTCASDIERVLDPYLTGKGLPGRRHRVVALPTQAQIQRVLAKMM